MAEGARAVARPAELTIDVELWRRRLAGVLLHGTLAGRKLPENVEGLTGQRLVDHVARMQAKELLDTLKEIYGIDHWDHAAFENAFVEGALQGWKPGSDVQDLPHRLRVLSHACPIADEVEKDARVCSMCQAVQTHAARIALRGDVQDAYFSQLMSRGDGACQLDVVLRPRGKQA